MQNWVMTKKGWVLLIGAILIVAAGLWWYFLSKPEQKPLEVKTTQLDKIDVPAGLPQNLPMEQGSKVVQNYESTTNDGRKQSTRIVTSSKQPSQALDVYIKFFQDAGFIGGFAANASIEGGQQVAQMQKNQDRLTIIASQNGSGQTNIEFTLNQPNN